MEPPVSLQMMTMSLGVRPLRSAVLVHVPGELPWRGVMSAALASQTAVWGGSGNIVLPYAGAEDSQALWRLLDVVDPDRIVVFSPSWGDVERIDAEVYQTGFAALVARLGEAAAQDAKADWRELPVEEPTVPHPLEDLLVNRLAPFHSTRGAIRTLTGHYSPAFEETSIGVIGLPPKRLVDQVIATSSNASLYGTALLGRYSAEARAVVEQSGASIGEYSVETASDVLDVYEKGVLGAETAYPWQTTETGLGHYRRAAPRRRPVVVVGDDIWDFAFFYALMRMGEPVWWCPTNFLDDGLFRMRLMRMLDRAATGARWAHVVSVSSHELAGEIAKKLGGEVVSSKNPIQVGHTQWESMIPEEPNRLFEKDGYGLPQAVFLEEGRSQELPTPIPRVAPGASAADLHWITEVRSETWCPVRNPELGAELLQQHLYDTEYLRTTREGVAYFCPNYAWGGSPSLETVAVRPRLRPWPLLEQLREIALGENWRVEPSDKGIYASESAQLFGGFRQLDEALREAPIRRILDCYLKGEAGLLLRSDRRRYLALADLRDLAQGAPDVDSLIASLVDKRVLTRGYPLKCERCRQVAWYSLDDVGTTFRCGRCRLVQEVGGQHFLTGLEPVLHYQLAEVIHQMLEHDGDLPLRAAVQLVGKSQRPTDYCFELEFISQDDDKAEHDVVVSDGYRLWIGEATKTDRLEQSGSAQYKRLMELKSHAEMLRAYGVLLATTSATFSDKLKVQAQSPELFGGPWPRLVLMEGVKVSPR